MNKVDPSSKLKIKADKERRFELVKPFAPTGDQPEAIDKLVKGIQKGVRH